MHILFLVTTTTVPSTTAAIPKSWINDSSIEILPHMVLPSSVLDEEHEIMSARLDLPLAWIPSEDDPLPFIQVSMPIIQYH